MGKDLPRTGRADVRPSQGPAGWGHEGSALRPEGCELTGRRALLPFLLGSEAVTGAGL